MARLASGTPRAPASSRKSAKRDASDKPNSGIGRARRGAFESVTAELPPFDVSNVAGLYMPYRFGLLAPADRAALMDGTVSLHDTLARRLYSPLRSGLPTQLAVLGRGRERFLPPAEVERVLGDELPAARFHHGIAHPRIGGLFDREVADLPSLSTVASIATRAWVLARSFCRCSVVVAATLVFIITIFQTRQC